MNTIAQLIELANTLDQKGLKVEADKIDSIVQKARGFWCDKHKCMKTECGCGKDKKKKEKVCKECGK